MTKVYVVSECCDMEYGCKEAIEVFKTREAAENYVAKRIANRDEDDFFDEKGRYYPWPGRKDMGCSYFSVDVFGLREE